MGVVDGHDSDFVLRLRVLEGGRLVPVLFEGLLLVRSVETLSCFHVVLQRDVVFFDRVQEDAPLESVLLPDFSLALIFEDLLADARLQSVFLRLADQLEELDRLVELVGRIHLGSLHEAGLANVV